MWWRTRCISDRKLTLCTKSARHCGGHGKCADAPVKMDNHEVFRGSGSGFLPAAASGWQQLTSCLVCFVLAESAEHPAAHRALSVTGAGHGRPTQASLPPPTLFCGKVPPPAVSSFFPINPSTLNLSDGQSVHTRTFFFFFLFHFLLFLSPARALLPTFYLCKLVTIEPYS